MSEKKEEYSEIRIKLPHKKDVVFQGRELAFISDRWIAGREQTRWNEMTLYQTKGGKFVVVSAYISLWQGEESTKSVKVYDTEQDLIDDLQQDYLGIELLKQAGFDLSERIE